MSSPWGLDEASSSKSKGKAVDPSEHPTISDGGANVDEADKDEDKDEDEEEEEEEEEEEDTEPIDESEEIAVNPPNPATSSKAKKVFGMHKAQPNARRDNDPSNYEDRFPEDPMYAETMPNARVWRTHQAESAIHDANMVEEIRDNVDVLLVFAGLFSAVVTAFVVQTSQSLQADYVQVSASLLFELVLVQRAIANGSPVNTIPVSSLNPQTAFAPTATDVWVNGLWFTSLFLSLTTALVAVLVKQWLHHYVVLPSETPRKRCFVRQYRYLGFQKWRVEVIVGLLPVLMHLALALFFIGLSLFLHPLRAALSWVIWTGTVLLIVAYVTVTILPMCFPQCPYRTPLCDLAYPPYIYITSLVQKHYHRLHRLLQQFPYHTALYDLAYPPYIYVASSVQKHYHRLQLLQRRCKKKVQSIVGRDTRINDSGDDAESGRESDSESDSGRNHMIMAKPNSLKQLELDAVEKASLQLSVKALHWLFSASSNPAVQSIVMESIGGLPMGALVEVKDVFGGSPSIVDVQTNLLRSLTRCTYNYADNVLAVSTGRIPSGMEHKFERLLRSCMFISGVKNLWESIDVPDQLGQNEFGATLVTQIPKLSNSPYGLKLCEPSVFLHGILSLETPARFPPIVWKNLIQSATTSWDPDIFNIDDQFPPLLCSAVNRSSTVSTDIPTQQLFDSPLVVDFEQAVEYFPKIVLKYMMCWLSRFDLLPGERLKYRVLAASIHLMIHMLSRSAADTGMSVISLLSFIPADPWAVTAEDHDSTLKILESVIVNTPIFSQNATDSRYDECSGFLLNCYSGFLLPRDFASRIHAPSSALQLLFTFMTTQWSTLNTSSTTGAVFGFLLLCLLRRFRPVYDVFHQQQCLKFLAMQPVSSSSASLVRAYVIGIAVAIHPSYDDPKENETISQAIDCLHEPGNLLFVCSTLAIYTHDTVLEVAGNPDIITAIAQIRPLDPAWGNCLQRLRALANAWDENGFVGVEKKKKKKNCWSWSREEEEEEEEEEAEEEEAEEEIKQWRCNMREAIKTLDIFFSAIPLRTTASLELPEPPSPQSRLDHVGRLRRPRQQDEENQLTEGV